MLIAPLFSWAQTTELNASLSVNQVASKQGDVLPFRLKIKANALENPLTVQFKLPLGFEWIPGQLKTSVDGVNWQAGGEPAYQGASLFKWQSASFVGVKDVWISFVLRMKSGSALGSGTVQVFIGSGAISKQTSVSLNLSSRLNQAYVADAFDQRACVIGTVWLDCNDDGEMSADELAIPGVRLYLQDGMSVTTDREGLYSICGLPAMTHVLRVDKRSLPYGVVLDAENSRNADNPNSKFVDLKYGEMHRADFKSIGCSVPVVNRVLSRIEAASSVDVTHYVEKMPDAFLSGASFNSDEDQLQVIDACSNEDDRIVCVQKRREFERAKKAKQDEKARIAKAQAEQQRLDENLRKAKEAYAQMLEQQKEALKQELNKELMSREKTIQKQDDMNKQELERKWQEVEKQAAQSLKFKDIKDSQNETQGIQLESIDLEQEIEKEAAQSLKFKEVNDSQNETKDIRLEPIDLDQMLEFNDINDHGGGK